MKHGKNALAVFSLVAAIILMSAAHTVVAQERQSFSKEQIEKAKAEYKETAQKQTAGAGATKGAYGCSGPVTHVLDLAFEGLKVTSANYFASPGGGEGGGFDKTPVLSTQVKLAKGACLNAYVSAIVGSRQSYGVAPLTLFQVTLTPLNGLGGPVHMLGHFEDPYGSANGPAVALEAEHDVDMYASNFFQSVGAGKHDVPPGAYRVDVWWSGNGPGNGGITAIGAAFVLKLSLQ